LYLPFNSPYAASSQVVDAAGASVQVVDALDGFSHFNLAAQMITKVELIVNDPELKIPFI